MKQKIETALSALDGIRDLVCSIASNSRKGVPDPIEREFLSSLEKLRAVYLERAVVICPACGAKNTPQNAKVPGYMLSVCKECGHKLVSDKVTTNFEPGWPDWRVFAEPKQALLFQMKRAAEWIACGEFESAKEILEDFWKSWKASMPNLPVGKLPNAGKMLEALKKIEFAEDRVPTENIRDIAHEALEEPPRQCDKYANINEAFREFAKYPPIKLGRSAITKSLEDLDSAEILEFCYWLFSKIGGVLQ